MDIVNEKIGIKDILSGLADLVFIKDTFSKMKAKDLVDKAPKPIKEKVTPEEAEALKAKFVEVGAEVEIK